MEQGRLIVIAGGNGVGKDVQSILLAERMQAAGMSAQTVYAPKANRANTELRTLLLDHATCPVSPLAISLGFFAMHAEAARVVCEMLAEGVWVLLNRGPETTLVYNVDEVAKESGQAELNDVYELIMRELRPDLTLLLDAPVEVALARAAQQGETDHFQERELAVHERRRQRYLELAKQDSWRVVDASGSIPQVNDLMWGELQQLRTPVK